MGNPIFREKINLFLGGATVGGAAGVRLLFAGPHIGGDLVLGYTIKFFGTIVLAFVSGIFTLVAHDLYKHKIKDRLFGKKKNSQKQQDENNEQDIID